MPSATFVGKTMFAWVRNSRTLSQWEAVKKIKNLFGNQFTYLNKNANEAIARTVLKEFKKAHGGSVTWNRRRKYWTYHAPILEDAEG